MLPMVITQMNQVAVSVQRLTDFLTLEELDLDQVDRTPDKRESITLAHPPVTPRELSVAGLFPPQL